LEELAVTAKQTCASKTSSPRNSRKDYSFMTMKTFFHQSNWRKQKKPVTISTMGKKNPTHFLTVRMVKQAMCCPERLQNLHH